MTTNAGGFAALGLSANTHAIVSVKENTLAAAALPFVNGGEWHVALVGFPGSDWAALQKNVTTNVTVYYRDL